MCGLTAVFAYQPDASPVSELELATMRDAMHRRGPDGQGLWIAPLQRIGLAHTRLAILDLGERAAQPMWSDDRQVAIVYNGELYNFKTLRSGLERKGHVFRTSSDTEVLIQLYKDRGEEMLRDLRGMYAFVIWDEKRNSLFAARDPYGIKPLYYADDGRTVRIASQVKALQAGGQVGNTIDPAGLCGFYLFGSVPEPFTIYETVRMLPAGAMLSVTKDGQVRLRRYDSITAAFAQKSADLSPSQLTTAVQDSVAAHLVSDVPVSVFLSAGVDSGALLGVMRDQYPGPVDAVTLEFESYRGTDDDEAPLAGAVADLYGANHHRHVISTKEAQESLTDFLAAMDQPTIDGLNTYLVSKCAHELGIKVALSGVGGDELFAGYPSFRDVPRWAQLPIIDDRISGAWHRIVDMVRRFIKVSPKLAGLLELGGTWPGAYLLRRGLFMPWELPELVGHDMAEVGLERLNPLWLIASQLAPEPVGNYGHVAALESCFYLRNQLLRDSDWAGMSNSVEIRTPWVDRNLTTVVAPAMAARGTADGKDVLANAPGTPLPDAVRSRRKTGFTLPMASWIESISEMDAWRRIPMLQSRDCHWARRWAYTVMRPIAA